MVCCYLSIENFGLYKAVNSPTTEIQFLSYVKQLFNTYCTNVLPLQIFQNNVVGPYEGLYAMVYIIKLSR
jgi:hypothetical protein